jgi:two-component system, OmpR family, response regulator ChvI
MIAERRYPGAICEATMTTVLLVDDEPETLSAWQWRCGDASYTVKGAGNGEAALAVLNEVPVGIVSDWRMPTMSGSALCSRIRSVPRLAELIFILVSAEPSPPAVVRYDGFLPKPVYVPELLTLRKPRRLS